MPKKNLPKEVIDTWPEVFNDIDVKVVPVKYLHSICVTTEEGEIWEIDIDKESDVTGEELSAVLEELFTEYEDIILSIDFRLDTKQVKEDIQNRTKLFLKKRK